MLDQEVLAKTRIPHWQVALRAVSDFSATGSGLGTYRFVYAPYEEEQCKSWFYHAENQYLEALIVGGIPGLGLMLIMISLVGFAAWRLLRSRRLHRM